jgi:hypothetical protein
MSQAQGGFGVGVGQLKGDGIVGNLNWEIVCFSQMEGRMVGAAKWGFYYVEAASGTTMVNWKNPVVEIDIEVGTSIPAQP